MHTTLNKLVKKRVKNLEVVGLLVEGKICCLIAFNTDLLKPFE